MGRSSTYRCAGWKSKKIYVGPSPNWDGICPARRNNIGSNPIGSTKKSGSLTKRLCASPTHWLGWFNSNSSYQEMPGSSHRTEALAPQMGVTAVTFRNPSLPRATKYCALSKMVMREAANLLSAVRFRQSAPVRDP